MYYVGVKSSFQHARVAMCCSVNGSVCLVCCVFDSGCELFSETIFNVIGCDCYFVVSRHLQHSICSYSLFS